MTYRPLLCAVVLLATLNRQGFAGCLSDQSDVDNQILSRLVKVPATKSPIEFVEALIDQGIPLSFIQGREARPEFSWDATNGSVLNILKEFCAKEPSYEVTWVRGRAVLHVADPALQGTVDVDIAAMARIDASIRLIRLIKQQSESMRDIVDPFVLGDPNGPVYSNQVHIRRGETVLGALMSLLGDDPKLTILVTRTKTGARVVGFKSLP